MEKASNNPPYVRKNGTIDKSSLFKLLYPDQEKSPVKSESTPLTHFSTMLHPGTDVIQIQRSIEAAMVKAKAEDVEFFYLMAFMYENALRVTEALSVRPYDITINGFVKIKALKHSNNRICHPGLAKEYLINCKKQGIYPFSYYTRFSVYRYMKRYGFPSLKKNGKYSAVTHIFRHLKAAELRSSFGSSDVTLFLGHKSPKNQQYYG